MHERALLLVGPLPGTAGMAPRCLERRNTVGQMAATAAMMQLLLAHAASATGAFQLIEKRCPEGCLEHGNCNIEEGRCECPW